MSLHRHEIGGIFCHTASTCSLRSLATSASLSVGVVRSGTFACRHGVGGSYGRGLLVKVGFKGLSGRLLLLPELVALLIEPSFIYLD